MPADPDPDPMSERRDGPTPAGGAYSVIQYRDAAGGRAPKSAAVACEVLEFDAEGTCVARTYAALAGR
jgi:hypothetical protein